MCLQFIWILFSQWCLEFIDIIILTWRTRLREAKVKPKACIYITQIRIKDLLMAQTMFCIIPACSPRHSPP